MTDDLIGSYQDLNKVSWASCTLTLTRDNRFELDEDTSGDCGYSTRTLTGTYAITGTSLTLRGKHLEAHEVDHTSGINTRGERSCQDTVSIQITHSPHLTLRFRGLFGEERVLVKRP